MTNGKVEIHDLFSNHTGVNNSDPNSDSLSEMTSMEDTVEFRLVMAYAKRRRPSPEAGSHTENGATVSEDCNTNGPIEEETKDETVKRKKKEKKRLKGLLKVFKCVKPQREEQQATDDDVYYRCIIDEPPEKRILAKDDPRDAVEDAGLGEVVSRLTELADDVPLVPSQIESDAPEKLTTEDHASEVEKMVALLLRESGDSLNEQQLKDANIAAELFLNYGFFKALINTLLMRMGLKNADPDAPGPQTSPKTQIAVTCEVTSRLTALDTLAMSRLLNHGARYLQDYYSSWAQLQGGYEKAFEEDEDEDEVE